MALPSIASLVSNGDWSVPKPHDYRTFAYTASGAANDDTLTSIIYKLGGSGGTTVATLNLTYVGSTNNMATMALTFPSLAG